MNVESPVRSIKRYSSKITIHRLENSVIRLWITFVTRRQQFPYVSMKTFREIPENNRRSRERLGIASSCRSSPSPRIKDATIRLFQRRENMEGEGSERVSELSRRWRGGGRGCSSTNWTPAAWQYNYGLLPRADAFVSRLFRPQGTRDTLASIGWKIPATLSSVSGETGNAIKIKSGKEISLNVEFHVICESLNLQEDPGDCSFILQRIVKISFEDSGRWYSARKRE